MRPVFHALYLTVLLAAPGMAQLPREPDWDKVRAGQPEGATLEMALAKKKFCQGE